MKNDPNVCLCHYEERFVAHTVRYHGELIVIDHVPAEVCTVCGEVLFKPETVLKIEAILRQHARPAYMVPLYEYA